jgi:hypothetical protein
LRLPVHKHPKYYRVLKYREAAIDMRAPMHDRSIEERDGFIVVQINKLWAEHRPEYKIATTPTITAEVEELVFQPRVTVGTPGFSIE